MPHEFIFVFIQYFIDVIMSEKSCQKWGGLENEGGMAIIGASCPKKGRFKPSTHHDIEELKVGTLGALNYSGGGG